MILKKGTKTFYRADLKKIETAHEYVLNIKNITAKRCYVARELFKAVLDSITSQEEECVEERLETEEEAKAILGKDFVERLEEVIAYCDKNKLRLLLHGTDEGNIPNILSEGLQCRANDLFYTSIVLSKDGLYSRLLNWPHKYYKGIIMLAIPSQCLDSIGEGLLPIWNGKKSFYTPGYELSPEFILGGLDIEHKSIIMNDAFSCEHDYSKFRLKNREIDELIVSHDDEEVDENEEEIDPSIFEVVNENEEKPNTNGETKQEDNTVTHSIPLNNREVRTLIDEERIFISSEYTPKTKEACEAIANMCETLAIWRRKMEYDGHFTDYEDSMRVYNNVVAPYLTDEKIEEILEEMKSHPEYFPSSAIIDEVVRPQESTDSIIDETVGEQDVAQESAVITVIKVEEGPNDDFGDFDDFI